MRRLIESFAPDTRQVYWRWIGGVFGVYVVLVIGAAGVFINHESSRTLAHERAATVAAKGNQLPSRQAFMPVQKD